MPRAPSSRRQAGIIIAALLGAGPALAVDIGDPLYTGSFAEASTRVEGIIEKFDRDDGTQDFDFSGTQFYIARLTLMQGDRQHAYVNAGWVDDDDADEAPVLLGVGAKRQLAHTEYVRIHAAGAVNYVPRYDTSRRGASGASRTSGDLHYGEASAGVLVSGAIDVREQIFLYGGLLASVLRGEATTRTVDGAGGTTRTDTDLEEDVPVVGVLGLVMVYPDNLTIRVEGRLLGDSSFSFAAGVAF